MSELSHLTTRTVRCPACGGASVYGPNNAYRPFCGERCKNLDLGAWASEAFRVPAAPDNLLDPDGNLDDFSAQQQLPH